MVWVRGQYGVVHEVIKGSMRGVSTWSHNWNVMGKRCMVY